MNIAMPSSRLSPFVSIILLVAALVFSAAPSLAASQPEPNNQDAQRQAMSKLSFLAGRWSGPLTVFRGPGQALHLTQTENVQYKLGGLVLLVEGKSTAPDGKDVFQALATIAYDEASHGYRIRAYHAGHYLDTALNLRADGFSWGFNAGPAHIVNNMRLTGKGEWREVTETTVGNNPPHPSVQMVLHRLEEAPQSAKK